MIVVNRTDFLGVLDMVAPGLSNRQLIEQSSCYVFKLGKVYTYNDEVSCRAKSGLPKEFAGAVDARPLTTALRAWPDDEVTLAADADKLTLKGKNKVSKIAFQQTVLLDTSAVEKPEKWRRLPPDFAEAVTVVSACVSPKQTPAALNSVHVYPDWMDATDTVQMCRYAINLGLSEPVQIRKDSLKAAVPLGMIAYAETENWLHFRNEDGLTLSVRLNRDRLDRSENAEKSAGYLAPEPGAATVVLPKGLAGAVERAADAAEEIKDSKVLVKLRPDRVVVQGVGTVWEHTEQRGFKYAGKPRDFLIAPALLVKVIEETPECEIGETKIRVCSGKWTYMAELGQGSKEAAE